MYMQLLKGCTCIISVTYASELAEILKLIITILKLIDTQLKSAEVIRPIKSIKEGNSSHLMIKKASCHYIFAVACLKSMSSGIISIINITDL